MNCKPGDLAIQIMSYMGMEGQIVKIVSWIGERRLINGRTKEVEVDNDVWLCEVGPNYMRHLAFPAGFYGIKDSWLRPISGLPMEEETEQKLKEPA